jgi:hypothetical protein
MSRRRAHEAESHPPTRKRFGEAGPAARKRFGKAGCHPATRTLDSRC